MTQTTCCFCSGKILRQNSCFLAQERRARREFDGVFWHSTMVLARCVHDRQPISTKHVGHACYETMPHGVQRFTQERGVGSLCCEVLLDGVQLRRELRTLRRGERQCGAVGAPRTDAGCARRKSLAVALSPAVRPSTILR